jgi:hypothetical protein
MNHDNYKNEEYEEKKILLFLFSFCRAISSLFVVFFRRKKTSAKRKKRKSLYLHVKFNHSRSNRTLSQCQFEVMDAAG